MHSDELTTQVPLAFREAKRGEVITKVTDLVYDLTIIVFSKLTVFGSRVEQAAVCLFQKIVSIMFLNWFSFFL